MGFGFFFFSSHLTKIQTNTLNAEFFFKGCTQWTDVAGENIRWIYKNSACLIPALQTWHHCAESIRRGYHHRCCSCRGPSHKRAGPGEKQRCQYSVIRCLLSGQCNPQERTPTAFLPCWWCSSQSAPLVSLLFFVNQHSVHTTPFLLGCLQCGVSRTCEETKGERETGTCAFLLLMLLKVR